MNPMSCPPRPARFLGAAHFFLLVSILGAVTALAQQRPPQPSAKPPASDRPAPPTPPGAKGERGALGRTPAVASDPQVLTPLSARPVSGEAFEALVRRRQPAVRATAPSRGHRGTHPAVGGATLTNPLPAGAPRVDARRPAGDVAAYGGLLELTGVNLGAANVKVRHGAIELAVLERHPTLLVCALPAGGSAPTTAKLELSSGLTTASGWSTVHPAFRLVPEANLQPRAVISSFTDGPLSPGGLPYPRTRYTTEITFHEVPGNVVNGFWCKVTVPEVFQKDYVVTREFGFNSFKVSIPEAELPGYNSVNLECSMDVARAGVPDSRRTFHQIVATTPFGERATVVVEDTHALRDVLSFAPGEFFGLTQGTSQGLAGPIEVGLLDLQGDLAFRIASAPVATYAVWVSSLVPLNNGWVVMEMKWEESVVHPPGTQPIAEVLRKHHGNGFSFDIGQKYVGWTALRSGRSDDDTPIVTFERFHSVADVGSTPNPSPYDTENRRYLRPFRVALRSKSAATNDNRATARLVSVTLTGPEGVDWRDAFGAGVPYDEGRWLVGTMKPSSY